MATFSINNIKDDVASKFLSTVYHLLENSFAVDELLVGKLLSKSSNYSSSLDIKRILSCLVAHGVDFRRFEFGLSLLSHWTPADAIDSDLSTALSILIRCWCKKIRNSKCPAIVRSSGLETFTRLIAQDSIKPVILAEGVVDVSISLLNDVSMFVSSKAQRFLSRFISNNLAPAFDEMSSNAKRALDAILNLLDSESHFLACLVILRTICESGQLKREQVAVVESRLLKILYNIDDEISSWKICEVLICLRLQTSLIDDVLKHLIKSEFIETALNFSCRILSKTPPSDQITKLESFIWIIMDSNLKNNHRSEKILRRIASNLSQLDHHSTTKEFHEKCANWFCDILLDSVEQMQTLNLTLLEGLPVFASLPTINKETRLKIITTFSYIIEASSSNLILIKALHSLSRLIRTSPTENLVNVVAKMGQSLARLSFHLNWEVQDSVLELISQLASMTCEFPQLRQCIITNQLHSIVWDKFVTAEESFVRASALHALTNIARDPELLSFFREIHSEQEIMNQVLSALFEDTEAVVRRAAVATVLSWYQLHSINQQWNVMCRSAMQKATYDLDWEVKLGALKFWEHILLQVQEKYTEKDQVKKILDDLDKLGFCKALLIAIEDYDSSVRIKASSIVEPLQRRLLDCHLPLTRSSDQTELSLANEKDIINSSPKDNNSLSENPVSDDILEEILNTHDSEVVKKTLLRKCEQMSTDANSDLPTNIISVGVGLFTNALLEMDLRLIESDARNNADMYEDNLDLLLDDILACLTKHENKDVILDCY